MPCGTFQDSPSLAGDVDGGVQVAVVTHAARGAIPYPFGQRQSPVDVTACGTRLAGRIEPAHPYEAAPRPCAFVLELARQLRHGGIAHGLGEAAVPLHAPDVQVLDRDVLAFSHRMRRELVQGVLPPVGNLLVRPRDPDTLPGAICGALPLAREPPLLPRQPPLAPLQVFGVGQALPRGAGGYVVYSRIDSQEPDGRAGASVAGTSAQHIAT